MHRFIRCRFILMRRPHQSPINHVPGEYLQDSAIQEAEELLSTSSSRADAAEISTLAAQVRTSIPGS